MSSETVLVVDDESDLRTLYATALKRRGWTCVLVATVQQAKDAFDNHPDIASVLTDLRLPDGTGMDVLRYVKSIRPQVPVTVVTAYGDVGGENGAVEAMRAGAFDYLSKPLDLSVLRQRVEQMLHAFQASNSAPLHASSPQTSKPTHDQSLDTVSVDQLLLGQSPAMIEIRAQIVRWAMTQAPVVVHGESGTGKERVAKALHACSPRRQHPFIAVNCGAIPEALMEAEFFGVRKGAFTGANTDRDGYFQAAQGGTLLLDEIADLPMNMQVKLLRVLQERKVRRVGDTQEETVDIRIVAASHKSLASQVTLGQFRQDLYYRLNVMQLNLPALRERPEDIALLAHHWLAKHPQGHTLQLGDSAKSWLQSYAFPGNIRELENILERAIALCITQHSSTIQDTHIQVDMSPIVPNTGATLQSIDTAPLAATPTAPSALAAATPNATNDLSKVNLPIDLTQYLANIERSLIEQALLQARYNRTAAAQLLGLNLRQLRYRIEQLGIE